VPIDTEAFGFWLKGALGAPVTTGTGPYTHVFTSGNWSLPSLSIETGLPEVPSYAMYGGCVVDKIGWQMARSGLLTANVDLIAQGETLATNSGAGTPAPVTLKRFGHFNGSLTRNGADIGNIVGADLSYANNLDRVETIRADGKIDGADPSIAALTGKIDVRFADTTLFTQAINNTECSLEFGYSLPTGERLTIDVHRVFLPRPRREIQGPQGIQMSFDWQAAQQESGDPMVTITLVNNSEMF